MKILRLLATVVCVAIAVLGLAGVVEPALLLQLGRSLVLPPALYGVAALRVAFGVLLLLVASGARMPRMVRFVGAVSLVAGLLTPLIVAFPFNEAFGWFSAGRMNLLRAVAALPVVGGIFLAYAIQPGR